MTTVQHGTVSGYTNLRCREECCLAAHREYARSRTPTEEQRERKARYDRAELVRGRRAERIASQLDRGEQIMNYGAHHLGMAALKARRGDPRPPGLTLSLVNWDSPDAYWGYGYRTGEGRIEYRLSSNPDDYAWETMAENRKRNRKRQGRSAA